MRTSTLSALALGLLVSLSACLSACGASDDTPGQATGTEGDGTEPTTTAFAEQVAVDHIAIYQGVKVTLVEERERVTKINAPVIPERPALVRVHAKPLQYRSQVRATAELRIHGTNGSDYVATQPAMSLVAFDDAELKTTFNFDVPGEAITPGATISVVLRDEKSADATVRFPEDGTDSLSMNVGALAPTLRVKFVPVKYEADGSGRTPDMSPAAVENYKNTLYKWYPASKVEVTVRDQLRWPLTVAADGDGWDQLLDALIETRSDDAAADDVYYIAVFDPAATAHEWCTSGEGYGCVLGIAPQANLRDIYLRVAMITGYSGNEGTLAQELGHAMGRAHAPCGGPQAVDPNYPYGRANIGVFGWDLLEHQLIDPGERVFDFMSYCQPNWVSDYTFSGLYERMTKVAQTKRPEGPVTSGGAGGSKGGFVQISHVLPDGSTRLGPKVRASDVDESSFGDRTIAGLRSGLRIAPAR